MPKTRKSVEATNWYCEFMLLQTQEGIFGNTSGRLTWYGLHEREPAHWADTEVRVSFAECAVACNTGRMLAWKHCPVIIQRVLQTHKLSMLPGKGEKQYKDTVERRRKRF